MEQINYIIEQSEKDQEEVHKSIHETRKSMKRIRAFLRMIRDEIGYSSYYRENVFYRDLNRQLSEIRNFGVLSGSIHDLQEDLSSTIPAEIFQALMEELARQRHKAMGGPAGLTRLLKDIAAQIEGARERIYDLPILHNDFSAFEGGLFRMYRQGKQYLKDARKNPTPTLLHDLRKKMKYFWYQVEILQPIFPGPMRAYAGSLEKITESLGVYHDIQVLQEFLNESNINAPPAIAETLQEACLAKKSMLLYDIWPMADIAYSEKPKAMVNRLASYWKVYAKAKPEPLNIFPDET